MFRHGVVRLNANVPLVDIRPVQSICKPDRPIVPFSDPGGGSGCLKTYRMATGLLNVARSIFVILTFPVPYLRSRVAAGGVSGVMPSPIIVANLCIGHRYFHKNKKNNNYMYIIIKLSIICIIKEF